MQFFLLNELFLSLVDKLLCWRFGYVQAIVIIENKILHATQYMQCALDHIELLGIETLERYLARRTFFKRFFDRNQQQKN